MNDDELKDAARSAFDSAMAFGVDRHAFERLAMAVRDAEREACAKVCEEHAGSKTLNGARIPPDGNSCARAIRMRSCA